MLEIARAPPKDRGIRPWVDIWELRPGSRVQPSIEEQVRKVKAAAIFVGKEANSPWRDYEVDAFLRQYVRRKCPVIPVILPNIDKVPSTSTLLGRFRLGRLPCKDPDPLHQLVRGIARV